MDRGLRKRVRSGLGAQTYARLVTVVVQVVTVPLLIGAWGVELYGAWLILTAIPAYLAMSDLGFATAAQNDMAIAVGRDDRSAALEAFQSAWLLVVAVTVVVVAACAAAVPFLHIATWLDLSGLSDADAAAVLLLLGGYVLVSLQSSLVYAGFHCEGRYGMGQFALASLRAAEFALLFAAVVLDGGPVAAAGMLFAGRFAGTIAMGVVLRRVNPGITLGWRHANAATVRRLARPALAFTVLPLATAVNLQGMVIVVGILFSPTAVVVFSTLRTLTRFGLQLASVVNSIVVPEISTAFGAENTERVRKLHNHACQVAVWILAAVVVGFVVFGEWLLRVWTGGAVAMQWGLFAVFLFVLMASGLWQASFMLVHATNRHMRVAVAYITVSVISLAAAYLLGRMFGLTGVAASVFMAEAFMVGYVLRVCLAHLDEPLTTFGLTVVRPPIGVLRELLKS